MVIKSHVIHPFLNIKLPTILSLKSQSPMFQKMLYIKKMHPINNVFVFIQKDRWLGAA